MVKKKRATGLGSRLIKKLADKAEARSRGDLDAVEDMKTPTPLDPPTTSLVEKTKLGRPTAFKPEFVEQAVKLYKLGFTDEEAADFFGVSTKTLYRWMLKHDDFRHATKLGKEDPDDRVERALYSRAVGYTYDAVKIFQHQGSEVVVPYKEHVPPDTSAALKWLAARRPDRWREVNQHEFGRPGDFANMTDDQLRQRLIEESRAIGLSVIDVASEPVKPNSKGSSKRH